MPEINLKRGWWRKGIGRRIAVFSIILWGGLTAIADVKPVVGPGATREEVIAAYGWPDGRSQTDTREVLSYPQGSITLENGRVVRIEFSPNVAWPAPKPPPPAATNSTAKPPAASPAAPADVKDFWLTDFAAAAPAAEARGVRILALFTGSDWSPPSRRFYDEVALHPDFIGALMGNFVFLRLDYPTHTAQLPALKQQNAELRERYGVTTYPALLILVPGGEVLARVDLLKLPAGATYREQVLAAINDVSWLLKPQISNRPAGAARESTAASLTPKFSWLKANALPLSLMAGILLLSAWGWWLRRRIGELKTPVSAKVDLPAPAELVRWPHDRLRKLAAALFEANGYRVELRSAGNGAELALYRTDAAKPQALVSCLPASAGLVPEKPLRELFGTVALEGAEAGWFISPGGFASEARDYARLRGLVLMNSEDLLEQLRALPPLALAKVVGRAGA